MNWFWKTRPSRSSRPSAQRFRYRPTLDGLEDRTLLAVHLALVLGLDNQVYGEKLDSTGHPNGSYFLTTPGQVRSFSGGTTAFDLPEVFVMGLDNQVYYQKFDANGN